MNAKHLFLTLIIGAFSVSAWGDEVLQAIDVISPSTLAGEGLDDPEYNTISGLSLVTDAEYSSSSFYYDNSDEYIVGIEKGSSFATSKTKTQGKIVSVSIAWMNDDASNNDDEKAIVKLYARNGAAYTGSETVSSLAGSELRHTFTYQDGVYTYNLPGEGFDYIALVTDGENYGAFFTSISITWEWTDRTEYTVSGGTITEGTWGTEVTASPTTAYAGDLITVTFAPKMVKSGKKKTYYSLTSYGFDGMEFDLSCATYIKNPNTYTVTFPMPARNVSIDATFEVVELTGTQLTINSILTEVGSGEELVIPFTLLNSTAPHNPIPSYSGTITAVADDGTILSTDAPVKVSDGNYTFTVHGKAIGSTTVTVTAAAQGEIEGSFDYISITVIPREIALVAKYNGEYYAMQNTFTDGIAAGVQVFYSDAEKKYYYLDGTNLSQLTWHGADPAKKNFHIQNPVHSDKYLMWEAGSLDESTDSYNWWKNGEQKFINKDEWGIAYNGSVFQASKSMTSAAVEALISNFSVLTYSTAAGAGIVDARSLTTGSKGTICVPFDVTDLKDAGADFFDFTGKILNSKGDALAGIVISEKLTTLEAGHSYFFQMQDGKSAITLTGANTFVTIAEKLGDDGFVGCLPGDGEKLYVPSGTSEYATRDRIDGCYGLSGGLLRYVQPGATASAKQYRAYIDASELPVVKASSAPRRRVILSSDYDESIEFGTDDDPLQTGIDDLKEATFINWNEPVYNIMGVQVGKGAKGVLIQNGQKFLAQ